MVKLRDTFSILVVTLGSVLITVLVTVGPEVDELAAVGLAGLVEREGLVGLAGLAGLSIYWLLPTGFETLPPLCVAAFFFGSDVAIVICI